MKWCVRFPEEEILIKRPCLRRACAGNKIAAIFLSFLLYQVSINFHFQQRAENGQGRQYDQHATGVTLYYTQREIVSRLDHEISDRTLRETAIPLLVALQYITVDDSEKTNTYTINLASIQAGIDHAPTLPDVLRRLQHLIEDSNTSAIYRKYFRRLVVLLQTQKGNTSNTYPQHFRNQAEALPTDKGNTSDRQNPTESSSHQHREPNFSEDKNNKSNKEREKNRVATTRTTISSLEETTLSAAASPVSQNDYSNHISQLPYQRKKQQLPNQPTTQPSPNVETILHLVEDLRGHPFQEPERQHQVHAAETLVTLQPAVSLQEIREAWLHGSDTYWRQHYDASGMKLTDLVHHNSHGKRRIFAVLEHQRRQQNTHRSPSHNQNQKMSAEHQPMPEGARSNGKATMSEQEAQQLAAQVKYDGQSHAYALKAECIYEHDTWKVKVHFERHAFTLHTPDEWANKLQIIQTILQIRQKVG